MEWTVELDPGGRYVRVTTAGRFSVTDHQKMVEDIVGRPFWKPGTDALFDHRALDMAGATYQDMAAARANHEVDDARIGDGKAAILVKSRSDFGSARQFELMAQGKVQARLGVFLDLEPAIAWLLE